MVVLAKKGSVVKKAEDPLAKRTGALMAAIVVAPVVIMAGVGSGGGSGTSGIIAITLAPPKIPPIHRSAAEKSTHKASLTGGHWTMCSERPVPSMRVALV